MREMKNSGLQWMGEIPTNWNVVPIGTITNEVTAKNYDGSEKNALKFTYGNIISKNNFDADKENYVAKTIRTYTKVKPGNIILNGLNLNYDFVSQRIGLVKDTGVITSAYLSMSVNPAKCVSTYLTYLFKGLDAYHVFHHWGKGLRQTLSYEILKKYKIAIPELSVQQAIADFLDSKCADIDSLTEDIQKQIETLKEYKKSVITQAVTKGLDLNVEMKDSGTVWLEKMPRAWKVQKLKYLCTFSKGLPITKADLKESGKAVISYGQVHAKFNTGTAIDERLIRYVDEKYLKSCPQSICHKNDFIFADTSEDYEGAGNCVFVNTDNFVFAGYHTFIASPANYNGNPKFLAYLFQSDTWRKQIRSKVSGIKVYSITQKIMKNIEVIYPQEIDYQDKIVDFLDAKCADIDAAIEGKQKQMDVLKEYKKSLIYEYVTGKKEVPRHE